MKRTDEILALWSLATALLAVLLATPTAASGREIAGVEFADEAEIAGTRIPLRGAGLLRYRFIFDAYVAAFYATSRDPMQDPLGTEPRRLEIEYFWALKAEQFASATIEGISANVSEREFAALEPTIKRFNSHYEDIEPGDRYALTFANGATELAKNGRALGTVEGRDFGSAIFAIWLGKEPLSHDLKTDLLSLQ